jgi:hypothetical protein
VLSWFGRGHLGAEPIEGDGPTIFRHACKLGLEGIVSKRKDSPYRSGQGKKKCMMGKNRIMIYGPFVPDVP